MRMSIAEIRRRFVGAICIAAVALGLSSCVHQFPEEDETANVVLNVVQLTEWLPDYDMMLTRVAGTDVELRYDFRIYPKGNTKDCVKAFTIYKSDLARQNFSTSLELMPGDYDVWCWSDYAYTSDGEAVYYDDTNFSNITYIKPYEGDSDLRDAFNGMTSFSISEPGYYAAETVYATIELKRPFARYKFIATDLADFIDRETTRGMMAPPGADQVVGDGGPRWAKLSDYRVKVIYPLYMPAVFDNFLDNPVDSWTGVSFDCRMTQLNADEAQLAMDYVMVNGQESGVQVMLEIYDPDGALIARTNTITVPTKRNRTTVIYGKFLTTLRSDGVGIDPDFDGEYNIELP